MWFAQIQFLAKNPTANNGQPQIVVEKLSNNFFVQFTGDHVGGQAGQHFSFSANGENPNTNDVSFTCANHDLVSPGTGNETWVSATQLTNGVEGDTIPKGKSHSAVLQHRRALER